MGFDALRFEAAQFAPRTKPVPVPDLAHFFGPGEPAIWTVRGLNSNQLHAAQEAGKRNTNIEAILEAIAKTGDQVQAVRAALGIGSGTPGEIARRLELLVAGSVDPVITLTTAVKLAETFPVEFMTLTNEISVLTGQGFDLVKPIAASPQTPD